MKKIVLLLYWIISINGTIKSEEEQKFVICHHVLSAYQALQLCDSLGMKIWEDLDLLGAIRTSSEDLMYFAHTFITDLLDLKMVLNVIYNFYENNVYTYEEIENIHKLLCHIDERYNDIFSSFYSKEIACGMVLIEKMLRELEQLSSKAVISKTAI